MKNSKITRKITQGMYVLTTKNGGCIVDAVSQISAGVNPLIAVSVMKNNYTNQLLKQNKRFALSILGKENVGEIIKTFGFSSSKDTNKFEKINILEILEIPIIKDTLGYMICDIIDDIENETHTLFIGKLIEGDVFSKQDAMSYQYYQDHKEEILKVTTFSGKTYFMCTICGYIYENDELPSNFTCPKCGVSAELFVKKEK